MATIDQRGPYQFRARVRRNGITETRTFETRAEAEKWAAILEGKVIGDEYQDRRAVKETALKQACEWMVGNLDAGKADTKNKLSKLRYWQGTEFANWSLVSIRPADLLRWRRKVLYRLEPPFA